MSYLDSAVLFPFPFEYFERLFPGEIIFVQKYIKIENHGHRQEGKP
jgi:hypothetical protein